MKKDFSNWMTILMVAILGICFASCGGDDDEKTPETNEITILGIWYGIEGADVVSYQYNADGTGIFSYGDVMVKFSYSYDANAKRLTQTVMGESYVYEITTLTKDTMVGKNIVSGGIRTFTRQEPDKPLYEKDGILYVNVYEAGVFPDLIDGRKTSTTYMKISGNLNGTDFRCLRDMMITENGGKLTYLDMSDASIVEGGGTFYPHNNPDKYDDDDYVTQKDIITKCMFEKCDAIKELILPNSVIKISHYMFGAMWHTQISSITIGRSINGSIDHDDLDVQESLNVLAWMDKLEEINVHPDNPKYSSENGIMFSKDKTTLYRIPRLYKKSLSLPIGLTTIGESAFLYYDARTIQLPSSVRILKNRAFRLSSIETIDIGNVVEMEEQVFMDCDKLKSINLPQSLSIIPEGTFRDCSALESITIPNNITEIGDYSFCDCSTLPSIRIPQSMRTIGRGAFLRCYNLHDIYIDTPNPPTVSSEIRNAYDIFGSSYKTITIYVPKGSKDKYASTIPWSELNIIEN